MRLILQGVDTGSGSNITYFEFQSGLHGGDASRSISTLPAKSNRQNVCKEDVPLWNMRSF